MILSPFLPAMVATADSDGHVRLWTSQSLLSARAGAGEEEGVEVWPAAKLDAAAGSRITALAAVRLVPRGPSASRTPAGMDIGKELLRGGRGKRQAAETPPRQGLGGPLAVEAAVASPAEVEGGEVEVEDGG